MQDTEASSTALLIAGSLLLVHHDPKYSRLVSKTSADFFAQMLEKYSSGANLFSRIVQNGWFLPIAKIIERITVPGILLHYALRKKCIGMLARSHLANGAAQVVVIGAGFDPLSLELHRDFPNARFWELDHPATQQYKVRAMPDTDADRVHFVSADLNASGMDTEMLIKNSFDPTQRTFWVAEGLLMYLRPHVVSSLMTTASVLSAPDSQFTFTFMEKQSDRRIGFNSQTKLVDCWLRRRGEPFVWAMTRGEIPDLVRPWRIIRFFDDIDLRKMDGGLADERLARGEMICLAEI